MILQRYCRDIVDREGHLCSQFVALVRLARRSSLLNVYDTAEFDILGINGVGIGGMNGFGIGGIKKVIPQRICFTHPVSFKCGLCWLVPNFEKCWDSNKDWWLLYLGMLHSQIDFILDVLHVCPYRVWHPHPCYPSHTRIKSYKMLQVLHVSGYQAGLSLASLNTHVMA